MSHDLTALHEALDKAASTNDAADRKAAEDLHTKAVADGATEDDFRDLLNTADWAEGKKSQKLLRRLEPGL